MDREDAVQAVEAGIRKVSELKAAGYQILATGEMGIGNTTSSSAMTSVLLDVDPEVVTGRGAGLTSAGLERKIQAIRTGNRSEPAGSGRSPGRAGQGRRLDIAGLTGVFLGCAAERIPAVVDGFISGVAALTAVRLCPEAQNYLLASHISNEPAGQMVLEALGLSPFLICNHVPGRGHRGGGGGPVPAAGYGPGSLSGHEHL